MATNNRPLQYGGSNAHSVGVNIVYGFPGEFFAGAEASQWLHWHESGEYSSTRPNISESHSETPEH